MATATKLTGVVAEHIRAVPKGFAASRLGKALMGAIAKGREAEAPPGWQAERPHALHRDLAPAWISRRRAG